MELRCTYFIKGNITFKTELINIYTDYDYILDVETILREILKWVNVYKPEKMMIQKQKFRFRLLTERVSIQEDYNYSNNDNE